MNKIPYIRYLEGLIISREPANEIHDKIQNLGVPLPIEAIEMVYRNLRDENPDHFKPRAPAPDPEWLAEKEVEKLYSYINNVPLSCGTVGLEGAFRIVNDPLMYRLITSLALAKITDEDIEMVVNGKYNQEYAFEDIKEFLHYFFDVSNWTLVHRQDYVGLVEDPDLSRYYKIALKGDKDYLLWKLGAQPDQEFDEMLKDMVRDSYYMFKEKSKVDASEAQQWGSLAARLVDRLDKFEGRMGKKDDMLEEVEFKITRFRKDSSSSEDEEIPHINELEK